VTPPVEFVAAVVAGYERETVNSVGPVRPHAGRFLTATGRVSRRVAGAVAVLMAITLAGQVPAAPAAAAPGWQPRTPKDVTGVRVTPVKQPARPAWTAAAREARTMPKVTWPAAGKTTLDLAAASARSAAPARAGGLPVWASPAPTDDATRQAVTGASAVGRVAVETTDRAAADQAGVAGVLIKVTRADGRPEPGTVRIGVDYSGFAAAYGGDWASRLRIVTLPDGKALDGANDTHASTVSAVVPLAAGGATTTVAVTAGPSGDSGDYTATSLSAAGKWQVSQQTGAFSWSYPINQVPAMGGPEPGLALSYSSGAVDGRAAGTNTQGSWIGDGWELWPGYIERKFVSCANDKDARRDHEPNNNSVNAWDQCWFKPEGNATIVWNGMATELVKSAGNTWKGKTDDGSRIELLKDTALGNGDNDGEYWKVTAVNGVQYFFGRHLAPGGSSGTTPTDSVWTTPVYGNHPDEPGYEAGSYAGSRTTQAWRWNLDYVLDPRGNTMSYFYQRETGAYGREGDKDKRTTYHRGGWLTRIEYGNRADAPATVRAAARIVFDVADRCVSNCWSDDKAVKASWLDTPWDQYCTEAPCTDQLSPTFWTGKRLSRIRAQVYSGTGDTYEEVRWWTLRHTYLQSGGNEGKPMWLAGITRTGKVTTAGGGEVSDPEIVFDPGAEALANRVDAMADGRSNLFRYRINTITTESGAQITVTYSPTQCTKAAPPDVHDNTKRCYPQYYGPSGEEPTLDWFHKYRVDRVDVYDNTGGFAHEQTNYDYLDTPAWHYDDSELVEEDKRTWGEYRGYGHIRVRTGLESGVQSATEYRYLRGMDEDKQPTGIRDVWVTDSQGAKVEDHDAFAGMLRETTTLLGAGGTWISGTITTPGKQGPTATSGPLKAWMTNTATVRTRTKLSNGTARWTKTVTTYNADNLPTTIDDLGDEATANDDICTRTWYARNSTTWMLNLGKKVEAVGVACAATAAPGDMLSATRTTYDADTNNWDTDLPVRGDVAKVEEIGSWSGTTPEWVTTGRSSYDDIGRVTASYDALDRKTALTYTPTVTGPLTSVTTTNALEQSSTITNAPAWQLPTTIVDANNIRTDVAYDGLGRLLKVWLPGRAKTSFPNAPSREYTYLVRNDASTAVTTKTHVPYGNNVYKTDITLYDGLLRARQTQTQAPGGGRVLADTVYDSRGLLEWASQPYYDTSNTAPNTTLVTSEGNPAVPARTDNVYDGAGRLTDAIFKVGVNNATNEKWRTTTGYAGERTSVIPPEGGVATTTITDARGRTTHLRQYKDPANVGADTSGSYDEFRYTHTDRNELASITDAAGNTWRYTYDQRGRKNKDEDPDRGVTTYTYDKAGQLTTSTDARNRVLAYTYDDLGRKTSLREESLTGPKRAEWTYDTLQYGIGKPAKSIRYEPAGSANAYTSEVTAYDAAGRPTNSAVTIPASEGGLCAAGSLTPCTYTYETAYRPSGDIASTTLPAAAGLASEKVGNAYNEVGLLAGVLSPAQIYLDQATYNKLGQLTQRIIGQYPKRTEITYTIDQPTGRVTNASAIPTLKPEIFNLTYSYDDAGIIEKISDNPAGGAIDTQCYNHDYLARLADAWTPTSSDCEQTPTVAGLGGPAPYWHSYTYHPGTDNRHTETQHGSTNTVRTYTYPNQGGAAGSHPSAVSSIQTTGATTRTETFNYDDTGNTATRPGANGEQTLTWDHEGKLFALADSTGTTSYVYDADGNRLIRDDPTGSTLYLPGGVEIRKPTTGAATSTRYYTHAGTLIAVRSSTGSLDWIVTDHHNTGEATVSNTDLSATRQRTLPFGQTRGAVPTTWPTAMDKGFVGGTKDNTGLTHLGAREYDPTTGRFISVDPLFITDDPRQYNAYQYGRNNPLTYSDPSGLGDVCGHGGGCEVGNGSSDPPPNPPTGGGSATPSTGSLSPNTPVPGGIPDYVRSTGYNGPENFTYGEAFEWAAKDPTHFAFLCYQMLGLSDAACKQPDRPDVEGGLMGILVTVGAALAIGCLIAGPACWAAGTTIAGEIAASESAFAGSGSMVAGGTVLAVGGGRLAGALARGMCSFSGDTHVLMADGTTKPLEEIKVGDTVLATDPETGKQGPRKVTHLWIHQDQLADLKLADGTEITTTEDHPFWNHTDQQWQQAQHLDRGDLLLTPGGARVAAEGLLARTMAWGMAYNLTVDDIHTYYVLAGDTPVLVHNTGCGITFGGTQLQKKFKHASDFGVTGNFNKANAKTYEGALEAHVHDPSTTIIRGTYRGDPVTHYYNSNTGNNVIVDPSGNFVSGWKLGQAQTQNLLTHGGLN
jgi:RHS repeat-associated protein